MAGELTRGAFLRHWRLMAIDGFELDVPDTPANAAAFGYPAGAREHPAFPLLRQMRFETALLSVFAAITLALAMAGVYAVMTTWHRIPGFGASCVGYRCGRHGQPRRTRQT